MTQEPASQAHETAPEHQLAAQAKNLLELAEKDRRAAEEAFEKLGYDRQLETAMVLQGDDLQEWLLLSSDCTDLVRALPPEHLHHAIKMIGEEDALSLLQAASSEQMQALMDIEWFTEGKLDRRKVTKWIELLLTLNEDEADQAMQGLDPNALAEYLRPHVKPTVSREQLLLALHMRQHYLFTPDDLECTKDLARHFLDFLYSVDRDLFAELLELIVAEEKEIVENDMYGGREDRLIKRGFPVVAKAEHLLEPIDARPYGIKWPGEDDAPAAQTAALQKTGPAAPFLLSVMAFGRAKGDLGDRTERAFIKDAADLANSLLIAHAKDPGEPNVKRDALAAVQVLASVGLEALAKSNVIAGVELIKSTDLVELFQLGWTLTREVAKDAWALAGDPRAEKLNLPRDLSWLPEGARDAVREA
ncbi:MAG: hypothetical protein KIS92_19835, partial [Planctomycetota bacterium]|nr:hypothetical protein [Planctomycetota bacterium]